MSKQYIKHETMLKEIQSERNRLLLGKTAANKLKKLVNRMPCVDIPESSEINIELLKDLLYRLADNYNNGTEFEQYEEDRLELGKAIEFLESVVDSK